MRTSDFSQQMFLHTACCRLPSVGVPGAFRSAHITADREHGGPSFVETYRKGWSNSLKHSACRVANSGLPTDDTVRLSCSLPPSKQPTNNLYPNHSLIFKKLHFFVRSEVVPAMTMKINGFWYVTLCILVESYQRFEAICFFCLLGRTLTLLSVLDLIVFRVIQPLWFEKNLKSNQM